MDRISIKNDQNIPQIACSKCSRCTSVFGLSLCGVKNRGCCFYFPEFGLYDLQRMAVMPGGLKVLDTVLSRPGAVINPYSIHVKGSFDSEGYKSYIAGGELIQEGIIRDQTIFFRVCPFVRSGYGCTLPPRHRTLVCNFFVCREILERPQLKDAVKPYIEERERYARWEHRENTGLSHILAENRMNLAIDFETSMELLKNTPMNFYEFPQLEPVYFDNDSDFCGECVSGNEIGSDGEDYINKGA